LRLATWNFTSIDPKDDEPVWVLDPNKLHVGDVVLSTTEHWVSAGIRAFTSSDYSHAAIHVGGGFLIEAVGEGVRRLHCRAFIYPKESYVRVLRTKNLNAVDLEAASMAARSLLYRPYSTVGAIGTKLGFVRANDDPGRFCSQLVAEAYEIAKSPLSEKPSCDITPADLNDCTALYPPTDSPVRSASKQAIVHSLGEMQPIWKLRATGSHVSPMPPSVDHVHATLLKSIDRAMEQSEYFRRPYHYFDALRQLTERFEDAPDLVRQIDSTLEAGLKAFKVHDNGVEPQPTIPGLVSDAADPDLLPIFDRGPTEECGREVIRLRDEILAGRDWDEVDWERTVDELRTQSKRTDLASLFFTLFWLLGDQGKVQTTYRWLAGEN